MRTRAVLATIAVAVTAAQISSSSSARGTVDGRGTRAGHNAPIEVAQYPVPANACCTAYAPCPLYQPLLAGAPCMCQSLYGPVAGVACRL
jgi:hypothetical protein